MNKKCRTGNSRHEFELLNSTVREASERRWQLHKKPEEVREKSMWHLEQDHPYWGVAGTLRKYGSRMPSGWSWASKWRESCRTQDQLVNERPNQEGCFRMLQVIVRNLGVHSEYGKKALCWFWERSDLWF